MSFFPYSLTAYCLTIGPNTTAHTYCLLLTMLTVIEKVLLLQNIDLFSYVTSEQLSFFAAIAQEVTVKPARILYRENDAPDGLYVLVSGSVGMHRGQEEIDGMGPNTSFGVSGTLR